MINRIEEHIDLKSREDSSQRGARNATWLALLFLALMGGVGLSLFFKERAESLPVAQDLSANRDQFASGRVDAKLMSESPPVRTVSEGGAPQGRDSNPLQSERHEELEESQAQLKILGEVLVSKNDNDPRLDQELRNLGPRTRAKMRELYLTLPQEQLSEKGTLVFLLGRNLQDEKDFKFIQDVLSEPACLSLANCLRSAGSASQAGEGERPAQGDGGTLEAGHPHDNGVDSVTLIYHQLVAVRMVARLVREDKVNASNQEWVRKTLEVARRSPIARVAAEAGSIRLP